MSMTIGPAMEIGGNIVEMKDNGKIQVTNPKGKVKTLTQDEFKKQTMKNADKIASGEDFEYKKDYKGLKIAGAAVATATVSLGIIYRKEIGKYMKNFTFKKFWNDIKGLFKSIKSQKTDKTKNSFNIFDGSKATYSDETLKLKNKYIAEDVVNRMKEYDKNLKKLDRDHHKTKVEYNRAFGVKKGEEAKPLEIIPRKYIKKDGSIMNKQEREIVDNPPKIEPNAVKPKSAEEIFGAEQVAKWKAQWEKFHPAK